MVDNIFHVTELNLNKTGTFILRNSAHSQKGIEGRMDYNGTYYIPKEGDFILRFTG